MRQQMKNTADYLRYGDIIMLNFVKDSKTKIAEQLLENLNSILLKKHLLNNMLYTGFLASYGFLNDEIYFEKIEKKEAYLNYRNYLFVVCPKLNSEFHDEYKKSNKHLQKLSQASYNKKKHIESLKIKILNLKKGVEKEIIINKRIIKSYMGKEVLYGQEIQLKHYISNMYLSVKNSFDIGQRLGMICKLQKYINKNMIFKFLPGNLNFKNGQKINYNSLVGIFNTKFKTYIEFDMNSGKMLSKYKEFDQQNKLRIPIKPAFLDSKQIQIQFSEKQGFNWKVILFRSLESISNKNSIQFFSLVTLRHTETEGYVQSDINYGNIDREVFVRKYKGEFECEQISVGSIWEIQSPILTGEQIKCKENDEGQIISQNLFLRNYLTDNYLVIDENGDCIVTSSDDDKYDKIINLYSVIKSEKQINNNASFYIKKQYGNYFTIDYTKQLFKPPHYKTEGKNIQNSQLQNIKFDIYGEIFDELKEDDLSEDRFQLGTEDNQQNKDPFIIQKLSQQQQYEIQYVQSACHYLYLLVLKMRMKARFQTKNIFKYVKVLNGLIKFLYGVEQKISYYYFEQQNIDYEKIIPIPYRQKLIKDMGALDLMIEIIYIEFSQEKQQNDFNIYNKNFFEILYNLFRISIMEYRPNELYASQWLDFIRSKSLERREEVGLNKALTELIDNNEKILTSRINKQMIQSFVEKLKQKETDYLTLIKAILISNNKTVFKNQMILNEFIFGIEENRQCLLYQMRQNDKTKDIEIKNIELQKWSTLVVTDQLSNSSNQIELSPNQVSHINFFIQLLEIHYDICRDKNFKAIDELKQIYLREYLIEIITSNKYDYNLKKIICKMLEILWIDTYSYLKIIVPNQIQIWENLENEQSIVQQDLENNNNDYIILKEYIEKMLYNSVIEDLSYLKSLLQLLKTMIEFGFCNDLQFFQNFVRFINNLFDLALKQEQKTQNVQEQFNKLKPTFSQNLGVSLSEQDFVDCLIICLDILSIILDYDFQYRGNIFFMKIQKLITEKNQNNLNSYQDNKDFLNDYNIQQDQNQNFIIIQAENQIKFTNIFFNDQQEVNEVNFIAESKIISTLTKLINFSPEEVVSKTFEILIKYYSKGQRQIDYLKSLQILQSHKQLEQLAFLKDIKNFIFNSLNNYEKIFFSDSNEIENYIEKMNKIIQLFQYEVIENLQKDFLDIEDQQDRDLKFFILISNQMPRTFLQDLNRNLNLLNFYIVVLKYRLIKEKADETNQKTNNDIKFQTTNFCKLVKKINLILLFVCKNNKKNKNFLTDNALDELILPLIQINLNKLINYKDDNKSQYLNQIFQYLVLLNFIIKDNKNLIFQKEKSCKNIIDILFQIYRQVNNKYFYCSLIFSNLICLLRYKNKTTITQNQNFIIIKLFADQNTSKNCYNIIHIIKHLYLETFNKNQKFDNIQDISCKKYKIHYLEHLIYFLSIFLDLLIACSINNNDFSCNQIKNFLSLEEIYQLIKILNQFTLEQNFYIKKSILSFYNCFYRQSDKEANSNKQRILLRINEILYFEMMQALDQMNKQPEEEEKFYFLLDEFLQSYDLFQDYLSESCKVLISIYSQKSLMNSVKNFINKNQSHKLIKKLQATDLYPSIKLLIDHIQRITDQKPLYNINIQIYQQEKIFRKFNYNIFRNISQQSLKKETYLSQFKRVFKSKRFLKNCKKELQGILREAKQNNVKIKLLLKNLIQILKNEDVSKIIILNVLRIIRFYLENADRSQNITIDKFLIKNFTEASFNLIERQNQLLQINIIPCLTSLINQYHQDNDIIQETLLICIGLLVGGNLQSADNFYNHLSSLKNNNFLKYINELLKDNFNKIKQKHQQENEIQIEEEKDILNEAYVIQNKSIQQFHIEMVCRILKLLQLLCEGQNEQFQNFLRYQHHISNQNSQINIVMNISVMLGNITKFWFVNESCLNIGILIFEFLIEVIQGPCIENQNLLYKAKAVEFCKDLIEDYHNNISQEQNKKKKQNVDKRMLSCLIKKSMKFLNTILEGNDDIVFKKYIANIFKWKFLISHLKFEFVNYYLENHSIDENNLIKYSYEQLLALEKVPNFKEDLQEVFYIFFFIQIVNLDTDAFDKKIYALKGIEKYTYDFFKHNSSFVEINFNKKIQIVYFVKHPACNFLKASDKKQILEQVDRSNRFNKIYDFVGKFNYCFDKMEYLSQYVYSKQYIIFNKKILKFLRIFCNLFLIIICCYYFIYDKKQIKNNIAISILNLDSTDLNEIMIKKFLFLLKLIYFIFTILCLIVWSGIYLPLVKINNWNQVFQKYKRQLMKKMNMQMHEEQLLNILRKNYLQISQDEQKQILQYYFKPQEPYQISTLLLKFAHNVRFYLQNTKFITMLLYSYFAYLGLTFHMIFFSFNLLIELYLNFEDVSIVYLSLTSNSAQLVFTFILMHIVIFNYALFGFNLISDNFFYPQIQPNGENMCINAMQCFLTIFSLGPRSSGCIGDILSKPSYQEENKALFYVRYFYDVSIFLLINLLFINIFVVVVIDNFSELRENKKNKDNQDKNVCFICSLEKTFFDTISHDYDSHVSEDHNIWDYIFFAYSIKVKDFTEFNGFESYVKKKIDQEDINWFPFYQTRFLNMKNDQQELKNLFEDIDKKIENMSIVLQDNTKNRFFN